VPVPDRQAGGENKNYAEVARPSSRGLAVLLTSTARSFSPSPCPLPLRDGFLMDTG